MSKHWALGLVGILAFSLMGHDEARGDISSPVIVPLHFTDVGNGTYKLGIYVGIGTGAAPALFEFDTGGSGFYAAYSEVAGGSSWWGTDVNSESTPAYNSYDSGLTYSGNVATAAVSLYGSANAASFVVSTPNTVAIGQMSSITKVNPAGTVTETLWSPTSTASNTAPPIDTKFYGDFGLSPGYNPNGINNLLTQMVYSNNVIAGYRIHVDADKQEAWIQIGLTTTDTASATAMYFTMNPDTSAEGVTVPAGYYSPQVFNADIAIRDPHTEEILYSAGVGITPDTGATTALHNTQNSLGTLPQEYDALTNWLNEEQNQGELKSHLHFGLSGTTTSGDEAAFFDFETSDIVNDGNVTVQNNHPTKSTYYLNTGITLFENYDVIYNLHSGIIGLDAVPEPSTTALALLALGAAAGTMTLRRRRRP